ncbi:L,D-transpeptidase family protein [Bradyrhizobium manausense]|uniref:L,D-transpeptidase n=1 Tax=Bradyrhizobium TaxID=374 RepID=UPI001BA75587|nr:MULTISPECIES: L,D-transpeptidase [Bradyrhizobium]MBR0828037.1 L,D-transpeptidase family protein [Bradyrhizobium manausense]UVO32898.1 L,D-transpeptidase family protein [Bradyrhizobium arachidis]
MIGVNGPGFSAATSRLWRLAIFTAAGAFGTTSYAEAALYYWPDYSAGAYYSRQPSPEMQRPKQRKRNAVSKKAVPEKETGAKPQGPLVIAVSIERQKVTVYDSNGVFAESPVSTGMKGHSTPMGVFSIIQKHKFHHSNIYSGAPMPYMQRITWSGVAMHAGVLPGYPASHGCIRMPMAFAVKMWNWTKMGARVVVAPGEMSPHSFSHPLLATLRVPPQPAASIEPQTNVADKADKGAEIKSASAEPLNELRSSVGHVMSDATTGNALARADAPADKAGEEAVKTDEASAKPAEAISAEAKPADTADAPKALSVAEEKPADKIEPAATAQADAVKAEPPKTDPTKVEAVEAPKAPDAAATATAPAQPATTDAKKDQTRVADPAPVAKPEPPKRAGQIAVFISRKDSKLYVRQNFAPLFEGPVTIAASDRPLGTHVFTAEVDKADSNALRWSVVSLPVSVRSVEREDEGRTNRRQRVAAVIPVAAKPVIVPNSPAEALDRLSIPADTMAKINEMLTSGGSIIVSDQGINQGETGEGTDFIVRLR